MTERRLCDLFLHEHTGPCADPTHNEALKRRSAGASKWYAIERREDPGGWRDYLEGSPIHCGGQIELQAVEYRGDDFGEYTVWLDKAVTVRYEADLSCEDGGIGLYTSIGGHEFRATHEGWMRFRWPKG